jgi:hypothetical protein
VRKARLRAVPIRQPRVRQCSGMTPGNRFVRVGDEFQ